VSDSALIRLASVGLVAIALAACDRASAQEDWQTFNASRQSAGEDLLRVKLEYGAGTLTMAPGVSGLLYNANMRYDAGAFSPIHTYGDGRLRLGFESANVRGRSMKSGHLNVQLGPDVPVELELQFGAAEANIDLGGIRVRQLDVQTGASRTVLNVAEPNRETCRRAEFQVGAARFHATGLGNLRTEQLGVHGGVGDVLLDFTGEWATDMTAEVNMGLGSLTLRMPHGLGVRIVRTGRLSSFDSEGLTKRGEAFYSADWETAQHKLSLNINAALGSVRVAWVDSR
jgi:hypothetical protein